MHFLFLGLPVFLNMLAAVPDFMHVCWSQVFGPFIGAYIFSEFGMGMAYYVRPRYKLIQNIKILMY